MSFAAVRANRSLTRACLGSVVGIYGAWNYSERGEVYRGLQYCNTSLRSIGITTLPKELRTRPVADTLRKYFLLKAGDPYNLSSWIGSSLSHRDLWHLLFNVLTWSSFAPILYSLPPARYAALIGGSAVAASGTWLYFEQGKPNVARRSALGSSGIVSGILVACTFLMPSLRASIMGIIPAPLWLITGGYFLVDTYAMGTGKESGIGHSAHIGGGVFGALFYVVAMRRYGGILGKR